VKCLKINDKWLKLILEGKKTLEIRKTHCHVTERIALGNTKTKKVEGYAMVTSSQELSINWLRKLGHKHQANDFLEHYANGKSSLFAWEFGGVTVEPNPYPYSFSTGCWCKASLGVLRCGASCLDCTSEMRRIRGHACRFEELNHSYNEMRQLRSQSSVGVKTSK